MKKTSGTIVFFGSGPVAAASLEALAKSFQIECVITKKRPPHHKEPAPVEELAKKLGLNMSYANDKLELDKLVTSSNYKSHLGVIVDFGVIVSTRTIKSFKKGIVNSHFSLLPEWRGADPITFSVLSGQEETGVSLMLIVENLDEGPLLAQEKVPIPKTITTPELTDELVKKSNQMLTKYLPDYLSGKLKPYSQPSDINATYSRKLTKLDGAIDWNMRATAIERQIRAYSGWPGSRSTLLGKDTIITEAEVVDKTGVPGEVLRIDKQLVVCCGEKAINVLGLKPAGKSEMTGQAFLAGYGKHLDRF